MPPCHIKIGPNIKDTHAPDSEPTGAIPTNSSTPVGDSSMMGMLYHLDSEIEILRGGQVALSANQTQLAEGNLLWENDIRSGLRNQHALLFAMCPNPRLRPENFLLCQELPYTLPPWVPTVPIHTQHSWSIPSTNPFGGVFDFTATGTSSEPVRSEPFQAPFCVGPLSEGFSSMCLDSTMVTSVGGARSSLDAEYMETNPCGAINFRLSLNSFSAMMTKGMEDDGDGSFDQFVDS